MKYTIAGIQQTALINRRYTVTDAIILSYLRSLFESKSKKIIRIWSREGKPFTYVSSKLAIENLPILRITPHTFQTNYLAKYVTAKILTRISKKHSYRKEGKLHLRIVYYYRFSHPEYIQLFSNVEAPQCDAYSWDIRKE
jgi:uncharacterized protein (DUF924 family)